MKTKVLVFTTWDDIVFQNRNTEYGAYVLRRSYHKNVLAGWLVSMGLILVPFVFSGISGPGSGISSIPKIKERIIELLPPPDVEIPVVPPPPARTRPQPLQANPTLPPLVTTDPVEEVPVDDTPPVPNNVVDGTPSGNAASYTDLPVVATNIATVVPERKIINHAEVMPQYRGGVEAMMKFIRKNMKYPPAPRRQMIGGIAYVSFVVNGDGTVSDVELVKGFHPDCDREAMRVISLLPGWIGGKQNDMPVNVRMVLPLHFKIE